MIVVQRLLRAVSPWSPLESGRLAALLLVGSSLVAAAWHGAAHEVALPDQVPWLTLGTLGFATSAYAAVNWLLRSRILVGQRMAAVLPMAPSYATEPEPTRATHVVVGPEPGLAHRPRCPLAAGRNWPTVPAETADRVPCGVCRP